LTVIITTASRVPDGPFVAELNNAKAALRGEIEKDRLFASLFMPDAWDDADSYGDPALWHKVNPHIGITVYESFYKDAWDDAQTDAEKMLEFKSKMLNIFTAASVQEWIKANTIKALQRPFTFKDLQGRPPTMVSIDLSVYDDFSAVGFASYLKDLSQFWIKILFYIPEETLRNHPNRMLYEQWVAAGHLKVCPGKVISDDMIVNDIIEANDYLAILQIGYDAYKSQEVINALASAIASQNGNPDNVLRAVPQTYGAFTSPVGSFEKAIYRENPSIVFCDNPIIPYCFENCYLDEDKRTGNKKPLKRKRNLKIDGAIVTLMDIWLFDNYERPV
jgi:phage terminase large subunit-like protein